MSKKAIYRALTILIIAATLIKLLIAALLDLGNDEVYYYTYALFPDLSHFDHPPAVGWIIQIFTFGMLFQDELFIRLGAVLLSSVNIYLVYIIGYNIRNARTGWFAALLFTSSLYGFIISGTFILPDAPQMICWLSAIYFAVRWIKSNGKAWWILLFGITAGLALISKHTSVFLWVGLALFILLYKRAYLKKPALYVSALISLAFLIPVLLWNVNNDWISFTYQGERVNFFNLGIRADYFFTELFGQIAYNNPVNFVIILISILAIIRKKKFLESDDKRFLLLASLPVIMIFLLFSLFRQTLPHWSAPGYSALIIIAAAYLDKISPEKRIIPAGIKAALALLIIVIILGVSQINYGLLFYDDNSDDKKLGSHDFSLDMYGWDQLRTKFVGEVLPEFKSHESDDPIVSYRWFPAAHLDYYLGRHLEMDVIAIGDLDRIHKYAWINNVRGGFSQGDNASFFTFSTDYFNPEKLYAEYYQDIYAVDTINIIRNNKTVKKAFVYRMENLIRIPESHINK